MRRKLLLILLSLGLISFGFVSREVWQWSRNLIPHVGPPLPVVQAPPAPVAEAEPAPVVVNMGGPVVVDEFMFANMMNGIKPGMIAVWHSPYGDRYAIRRLPTGHITSDQVRGVTGMTGDLPSSPSPEVVRDVLLQREEHDARLAKLALRYPLPDNWPQDIRLWKAVIEPASKKVHLAPIKSMSPEDL